MQNRLYVPAGAETPRPGAKEWEGSSFPLSPTDPPPLQLTPRPSPTPRYCCIRLRQGLTVPGEPGPHQTYILSIWQGISLRHLCLGFKRETAFSSPRQAESVLLQFSSSSQCREAGAARAMPTLFPEVVSPASLGHSSPTPECRLLVSQLENLVTNSGTWYPHHPVTSNLKKKRICTFS